MMILRQPHTATSTMQQLTLKDVSRLLKIKPYRISYALAMGLLPERACRFGRMRVFQPEDIERLAAHFGV